MERYKTIEAASTGTFKDKGSKFIAFAFPLKTKSDIKAQLTDLKGIHPKATHHCYAYRWGFDDQDYRANDDGEPSGSAGRPILGQIDSHELTNVLIIVVRYYGGTKLGVAGLISAYKEAAKLALSNANPITKEILVSYELSCDYENVNAMLTYVKRLGIEITTKNFDELCTIKIVLKMCEESAMIQRIKDNHQINCKIRKLT